MALDFGGAANRYINLGSGATIDDIPTGTVLIWCNYNDNAGERRVLTKGSSEQWRWEWRGDLSPKVMSFIILRVSAPVLQVRSNLTNYVAYTANKPLCLVATWDVTGVDTDQKTYIGDLNQIPREPSSYVTQTVGSVARNSDAAGDLILFGDTFFGFDGLGYVVIGWRHRLHPQQIVEAWKMYRPGSHGDPRLISPDVLIWMPLGQNGASQVQRDFSGQANHGIVTGATSASDHPLFIPSPIYRRRPRVRGDKAAAAVFFPELYSPFQDLPGGHRQREVVGY